jgi:hypothetical protein
VTVDLDGMLVEAVFCEPATKHSLAPEDVPEGGVESVGWVRRSDTGEIEGFLYADMTAQVEADIRISIGKPYENVSDERREVTEGLAEDFREVTGMSVELEVIEYRPKRYGLGLIEWTAIYIGVKVADTLIEQVTSDLYEKAKKMLADRKAKSEGRPNKGFVIYGPDGEPLRQWDTKNGDRDVDEDN